MGEVVNPSSSAEARNDAENFFRQGNLDMALKSIMRAAKLEPRLPVNFEFFAAYITHKAAAMNKSFYTLLRIRDPFTNMDTIKKQYRSMAKLLHPDKNKSIAAANAFSIVNAAYDVLSDHGKRLAYNCRMGFVPKENRASPSSRPKTDNLATILISQSQEKHRTTPNTNKRKADQSPTRTASSSSSKNPPTPISCPERSPQQSPKRCKGCNREL